MAVHPCHRATDVALRPRLNDLTVEVDASLRLAPNTEVDDLTDIVGVHEARPR